MALQACSLAMMEFAKQEKNRWEAGQHHCNSERLRWFISLDGMLHMYQLRWFAQHVLDELRRSVGHASAWMVYFKNTCDYLCAAEHLCAYAASAIHPHAALAIRPHATSAIRLHVQH